MDDVKTTLRPIEWTESVRIIDRNSLFPMVVKPTPDTARTYEISEDPVLLHNFWITQRVVAQSLEDEGAYVVGPQLEIPVEYSGTFRYRDDQKGNEDVVQIFPSVKEIALSMPEKVFTQERLVVYPQIPQEDATQKVSSVILEPLEQLTVIDKKDVNALLPVSRSMFTGRPKYKYVPVPCVTFIIERTREKISLPVTTRGNFSTLPNIPIPGREFNMKGIISEIDFPINLTTCHHCPQSLLDEHHLRPEMRLRLTAIEEHEVIIGVTTQENIVEFAADEVEFLMPKHLDGLEDQEVEYQTALQRFLMECQIKNSPVNIKDYKKSIRTHISRNVRVTNPTALSQVSRNRVYKVDSSLTPAQNGLPAIAFFSSTTNSPGQSRRSSLPSDSQRLLRHSMPLPPPPVINPDNPPLPPRNNRNRSSLKLSQSQRPLSARPFSTVVFGDWGEFPNRPPPPPPPTTEIPLPFQSEFTPDRQKLSSVGSCTDTSFSTTSSTASPEEQVLESLDENYLRKWREDRGSFKKRQNHQAYENVTPNWKQQDGYSPDVHSTSPLLTFDEPARPLSPQFALPEQTQSATSVSSEPVSDLVDVENYNGETQQKLTTSTENYENASPLHLMNGSENNEVTTSGLEDLLQMSSAAATDVENNEEQISTMCEDFIESSSGRKNSVSSASSYSEESEHSTESSRCSSSSASKDSKRLEEKRNGYFHVSQYSVVSEDSNPSTQISFTCNYVPAPQDWIPPSDLSQLSVSEVANSLRYIGMNEDTVEWFRAEKVDGQLLSMIGDEEFSQHFRLTPFQRKKIVMFLKGWRPKIN